MSIEIEYYKLMAKRRPLLQRLKALFVFPPLPRQEAPPNPPSGGPIEVRSIAPSLDTLHPAFEEPIIGYMSRNGFRLIRDVDSWSTMVCRDPRDLVSRYGLVEVEIRFRRVVDGDG